MVKYNIDFYPEIACDACGDVGAYDVDGEYLCVHCVNNPIILLEVDMEEEYREEDEGYC